MSLIRVVLRRSGFGLAFRARFPPGSPHHSFNVVNNVASVAAATADRNRTQSILITTRVTAVDVPQQRILRIGARGSATQCCHTKKDEEESGPRSPGCSGCPSTLLLPGGKERELVRSAIGYQREKQMPSFNAKERKF